MALSLSRIQSISARIDDAGQPADAKCDAVWQQLFGAKQIPAAVVAVVLAAIRQPQFMQIVEALKKLPDDVLQRGADQVVYREAFPDYISLDDFRHVWQLREQDRKEREAKEARSAERGMRSEAASPPKATSTPPAAK